jgi:hypothetical protein
MGGAVPTISGLVLLACGSHGRYVRIEIELALDHNVRIIPLLVDGAQMPGERQMPDKISQICFYQAAPVRAGLDFRPDMVRVLDAIKNPPRHATI